MPEDEALVKRPTFWSLADDLATYTETLEMVQAEMAGAVVNGCSDVALLEAECKEIQAHRQRLGKELIAKTDNLAGVMRRLKSDITEQDAEQKRLYAKRKATEKALAWLNNYTASVMEENGWKSLRTTLNTITLRGNGGVAPLVITDESLVPDECCRWEGWVDADVWQALRSAGLDDDMGCRLNRVPNNTLIREALEKDCPVCKGTGQVWGGGTPQVDKDCSECAGSGKQGVIGCRLLERGHSVIVR